SPSRLARSIQGPSEESLKTWRREPSLPSRTGYPPPARRIFHAGESTPRSSQAETLARTMDLHRMHLRLLAVLMPRRVKVSAAAWAREVRGLGDDRSQGLSPRSRGALLGCGDALKIF